MTKKHTVLICILALALIGVITIFILNAGLFFDFSRGSRWRMDQTEIIQYLYPASLCIQIAEENQIDISVKLKEDLRKYAERLFIKLDTEKLCSTQIGQLIWLNDHYGLDHSERLLSELNKFYYDEGLFSFIPKMQGADSLDQMNIGLTCEIYRYIKTEPERLGVFDIAKGLASFVEKVEDIQYFVWGTV